MGGRYPEPVSSLLFRNVGGRFELDEVNRVALENIGMVSGAVFADLTGNGYPELVLACEWGPIRILANDAGRLREVTREMGLDHHTGWWNGINVGDFDGDGHLDLVASNWGRNTQYERRRDHPQRLYYGDLDGDGTVDLITSHYEPLLNQWVPNRMLDSLSRAVPLLTETFSTHEAYAKASIGQVLGDRLDRTRFLEAAILESTVILNRQGRWEPRVLPDEAQFAPAFAVCVADYDGDGHQDLFLSQNFFGVELDTSRYDAGRGLWLQGDGRGGFRSVPGQESGVKVYGEQRGAAVCDYDGDGRVDLVVTQNSASTKLFRNVGGKPGLRVRLRGPAGNPAGIGAVVRLRSGGSWGPAYAVHAGAGYWSQDSAVLVLGHGSAAPTELSVQWPGGKSTTLPLNRDRREITVPYD
jgi:enediyne biosynthesis protein E4